MNLKTLVKISNVVATLSILLLVYWVFVFVTVEVFGLKVFRENMSQTFAMSILGILALMGGSLMINIMFNLTRIAQKHNNDAILDDEKYSKKIGVGLLMLFPLLFGLLFAGDYLTSRKKEVVLTNAAKSVLELNSEKSKNLAAYRFTEDWLIETDDTLSLMSETDSSFPSVFVIVKDSIDGSRVFLLFRDYRKVADGEERSKKDYIFSTSKEERDYLDSVFDNGHTEKKFSAHDGSYKLFYPFFDGNRRIVLYFTDFQNYGKIGS